MNDLARPHRGTIFVEDAVVQTVKTYPQEQYVLRLESPRCAARATAGSFVHLQCNDAIPMRRPLSIMRANSDEGWIEVLFKIVGDGLHALAARQPGDRLSSLGPIGRGFAPRTERSRCVLIGGGVGIPPMVFLAEMLAADGNDWSPLVVMGSEIPFPFTPTDSGIDVEGVGDDTRAAMPLLEQWGVPSRLASLSAFAGTWRGYAPDLARQHLKALSAAELADTALYACGPTPMLVAVAQLAADFDLPCQISLEEYMACAVGGCAGCTVKVIADGGPAMKRVCVDGPVFEASTVFPQLTAA